MTLWRIVSPRFVTDGLVTDGLVTETAPILRWARGKSWRDVRVAMRAKGWHGEPLSREESP